MSLLCSLSVQALLLPILASILAMADSHNISAFLRSISSSSLFAFSDERGLFLFLISCCAVGVSLLNLPVHRTSKCISKKGYYRRTTTKISIINNLVSYFILFIAAYIYNSLTARVYNLFFIAFVFAFISAISNILDIWFAVVVSQLFVGLSLLVILSLTFLRSAESYFLYALRLIPDAKFGMIRNMIGRLL